MKEDKEAASVEELQSKLEELTRELASQKILVEAYRKDAEQYKAWWLRGAEKIKSMKEDVEDILKMNKKIIERW